MGDIKHFNKKQNELKTIKQIVWIYSQDTGMAFAREKCTMLVMKSGKWNMTKGVELPNQVIIRTIG